MEVSNFGKVTWHFHPGALIRIYLHTLGLKIWTLAEQRMNKIIE